ncbi:TPA: nucleotidyltransferase family protein [Legionella anisa]
MTNDPILKAIVEELMSLYHCHTIILCGSRARGDFTASSDNDVAGIMKTGEKTHCTP